MMVDGQYTFAFYLCMAAGLSDAVDGFIAKRYNKTSTLGAYLDPLADKALLISVFVTLGFLGHLPTWLVVLVVSRDILIIGAVILSYLISHPLSLETLLISKANTAFQILLAIVVMGTLAFAFVNDVGFLIEVLIYCVAVTTVLSWAMYMIRWIHAVATWESTEDGG